MTVGELIEKLKEVPQDKKAVVYDEMWDEWEINNITVYSESVMIG